MEKNVSIENGSAFDYLKSLPPVTYQGHKSSTINDTTAKDYTDTFRATTEEFTIPISWTITKESLINLLGITSYSHYSEVTGVRFYAGINGSDQLTLIAVSTKDGTGCSDDLTEEDSYPYYDYADPCPNNCSNLGNLKATGAQQVAAPFVRSTGS